MKGVEVDVLLGIGRLEDVGLDLTVTLRRDRVSESGSAQPATKT